MIDYLTSDKPIGNKPHKSINIRYLLDMIICDDNHMIDFISKPGGKNTSNTFAVFKTQLDCDLMIIKRPEWFNVNKD